MHLIALVLLMLPLTLAETQNNNDFGPYLPEWNLFHTCKGPKRANCGNVRIENAQNMSDVIFALDFPRDCPVTQAKVTIASKQNNATKKMWNYSLDSPCQHFVLGPILVESFNLTNNCKINKGNYVVHVNMQEKASTFLGSSFFYGHYAFKVVAYNKNSNFFCVEMGLIVAKKSLNKNI